MTSLSISVAMATYNGARYLSEQLESLDRQTLRPTELIVSDDGSTDETREIVAAFARTARFPVKLLAQEQRLGFRENFLRAAAACSGDIVSFCDQDDVWYPGKLEAVREVMAREPDVLLCFHNSMIVNRDREAIQLFYPSAPCAARVDPLSLNPQFRPFGYSQSLRADLLRMIPNCTQTADWLEKSAMAAHDVFFFCLANSVGRIAYLDEPLVEYRQHGSNTYGVSTARPQPWAIGRLNRLLQNSTDVLRRYALVAREYAVAAREFGNVSSFAPQSAIENAVESWNLLAHAYSLRSQVQGGRGFVSRLKAFIDLQRLGFYGETGFWTTGSKAGIRDLVSGVFLAPLVTRFGTEAYADGNMRKSRHRDLRARLASGFAPPRRGGSASRLSVG